MKLILANNQTERFSSFYANMSSQVDGGFDYAGYQDLLFVYGGDSGQDMRVIVTSKQRTLADYDGVYINGYLSTYELAVSAAVACQAFGIPFVNNEMHDAPSLSKLSGYTKLSAAKVPIPQTYAGSRLAIETALTDIDGSFFPAVLKRADADRGIDNFKVADAAQARHLLHGQPERSLWILQRFVPNDGYYVVSFYGGEPKFCIFRSLEARPDGNEQKAHMYKPKGGANARLIDIVDIPPALMDVAKRSMQAMNRQIGSVDCLYDSTTDKVHVLEVNYNPQLVTIETFKETRVQAFTDYFNQQW